MKICQSWIASGYLRFRGAWDQELHARRTPLPNADFFFVKKHDKQKNIPFQQMWLKLRIFPTVTLKFWYRFGNKTEVSSVLFWYLNLKIYYFQNMLFSEFEVRIT